MIALVTDTSVLTTEARCPECRRLLFKGLLIGEIQCPRCHVLVRFGAGVLESQAT